MCSELLNKQENCRAYLFLVRLSWVVRAVKPGLIWTIGNISWVPSTHQHVQQLWRPKSNEKFRDRFSFVIQRSKRTQPIRKREAHNIYLHLFAIPKYGQITMRPSDVFLIRYCSGVGSNSSRLSWGEPARTRVAAGIRAWFWRCPRSL